MNTDLFFWLEDKLELITSKGYHIKVKATRYSIIILLVDGKKTLCSVNSEIFRNDDDYLELQTTGCKDPHKRKGYGALLYNLMLILATKRGLWLMSDRERTSSDALRLWTFIMDHPEFYYQMQLDVNTVTDYALYSWWEEEIGLDVNEIDEMDIKEDNWLLNNGSLQDTQESFYANELGTWGVDGDRFLSFWKRADAVDRFLNHPLTKAYKIENLQLYLPLLDWIDPNDWISA